MLLPGLCSWALFLLARQPAGLLPMSHVDTQCCPAELQAVPNRTSCPCPAARCIMQRSPWLPWAMETCTPTGEARVLRHPSRLLCSFAAGSKLVASSCYQVGSRQQGATVAPTPNPFSNPMLPGPHSCPPQPSRSWLYRRYRLLQPVPLCMWAHAVACAAA